MVMLAVAYKMAYVKNWKNGFLKKSGAIDKNSAFLPTLLLINSTICLLKQVCRIFWQHLECMQALVELQRIVKYFKCKQNWFTNLSCSIFFSHFKKDNLLTALHQSNSIKYHKVLFQQYFVTTSSYCLCKWTRTAFPCTMTKRGPTLYTRKSVRNLKNWTNVNVFHNVQNY